MLHEDTYAVSKLTIEIIDPNYVCYESFSSLLADIPYVIINYQGTVTCKIIVEMYRHNVIDIIVCMYLRYRTMYINGIIDRVCIKGYSGMSI